MKSKYLFITVIVLALLFLAFKIFAPDQTYLTQTSSPSTVVSPTSLPQDITKCQTTIITPGTTVQLFSYSSGVKVRLDYRISSMDESKAGQKLFFYDGQQLYSWSPPLKFDNSPVPNPPGHKVTLSLFDPLINLSPLGEVRFLKGNGFSGDRLCSQWDDVDPVFEIPSDFIFNDSIDTLQTLQSNLKEICLICHDDSDCLKELSCNIGL